MPNPDAHHFDEYSQQTGAKHAILKAYLPAYLRALKNQVSRFHCIDGFAGPGTYADDMAGSPLLTLDLIDAEGLSARTSLSLVELRRPFFEQLQPRVAEYAIVSKLFDAPLIRCGQFADHLQEVLGRTTYRQVGKVEPIPKPRNALFLIISMSLKPEENGHLEKR